MWIRSWYGILRNNWEIKIGYVEFVWRSGDDVLWRNEGALFWRKREWKKSEKKKWDCLWNVWRMLIWLRLKIGAKNENIVEKWGCQILDDGGDVCMKMNWMCVYFRKRKLKKKSKIGYEIVERF